MYCIYCCQVYDKCHVKVTSIFFLSKELSVHPRMDSDAKILCEFKLPYSIYFSSSNYNKQLLLTHTYLCLIIRIQISPNFKKTDFSLCQFFNKIVLTKCLTITFNKNATITYILYTMQSAIRMFYRLI